MTSLICSIFCRKFCFLISNSLIQISNNHIYCVTWYFFPLQHCLLPSLMFFLFQQEHIHSIPTKLSKVPIFNYDFFTKGSICGCSNHLSGHKFYIRWHYNSLSHWQKYCLSFKWNIKSQFWNIETTNCVYKCNCLFSSTLAGSNLTGRDSWFTTRFWIITTEFFVIMNFFTTS